MTPTRAEVDHLVRALWEEVDNGHCDSCTLDACDALTQVWPEVDWRAQAKRIMDEDIA